MEEKKIKVTLDNGKEVEGEILFTFEANGDDFVLYSVKDEVFAAKVDENNDLSPVEDDEWPHVEKIFNQYMEDMENEEDK